jgi:hypothetical protein
MSLNLSRLCSRSRITYYGRLSVAGKKSWRSLKTSVISIARVKLDELLNDTAARVEMSDGSGVDEHLTGAQAIEIRKQQLANDASIKPSTGRYWNQVLKALEKKWPSILITELRTITPAQCEEWAGKLRSGMSSSRYNATLMAIKDLFKIAIKRGARRSNPASELKRAKSRATSRPPAFSFQSSFFRRNVRRATLKTEN